MAKELPVDCRCPACGNVISVTNTTALALPDAKVLPVSPSHPPALASHDGTGCGTDGYLLSAAAARLLNMHVKTLLKKAREGIYPSHGEGRLRKFLRHELDQVMQRSAFAKVAHKSAESTSTKRDNIKPEQP